MMTFLDDMNAHYLSIVQALDGREIIYSPQNGDSRSIDAMFQAYSEMIDGESVGIVGNNPVLIVRTIDIPEIMIGDQFTVSGGDYKVVAIRPDSEGITELSLEEE